MVKSAGNPIFLGNGAPKIFWPLLETLARTFFHNSLNEVNWTNISCSTVDCLNSIVAVLKINKDQAENYLKQDKRIKRMMKLAGRLINEIQ